MSFESGFNSLDARYRPRSRDFIIDDVLEMPSYHIEENEMRINDVVWGSEEIGDEPYDELLICLSQSKKDGRKKQPDHAKAATNPKYSPFQLDVFDKAAETNGVSLIKGATSMVRDLIDGGVTASDNSGWESGVNFGITPCDVVYETPLLELVKYRPVTDEVYQVPILIVSPLINGPEILDLVPGQSLVEHLLNNNQQVYMVWWKEATKEIASTSYEDYINAILEVERFIGDSINTVGLCMGGDLMRKAHAYSAAIGEKIANTEWLIVSMSDYQPSETGAVGAMIDSNMMAFIKAKTQMDGIMKGGDIAAGFNSLLPDGLIYGPMYKHWFLGEPRPSNPLMAWNGLTAVDIPAKAFIEYLTECYIKNSFAKGEFVINGIKVDPRAVNVQRGVAAGGHDHIVPPNSAFRSVSIAAPGQEIWNIRVKGGHVGAIAVKGSNPRCKYEMHRGPWISEGDFNANAVTKKGSWYDEYLVFLEGHSGVLVSLNEDELAA